MQARIDANLSPTTQFFTRYTLDDADQRLPLDYPQFPRAFRSRNQYATAELKQTYTSSLLGTYRFGYSRTRVGQDVEANVPLAAFVPVPSSQLDSRPAAIGTRPPPTSV